MSIKQKIGRFLINNSPVSPEVFTIFRVEFRALRRRLNYKLNPFKRISVSKFANAGHISLNVGSGPFGQDGWVNIDLMKLKNVSFTYDTRKHLPFKDNTVDRIRVEHFFEHLDHSFEAPSFLNECSRVMKQGAVLRIVVPDIEKFIDAYYKKDDVLWQNVGYNIHQLPAGFDTKVAVLNHVFRQDGEHKYGYDFEALTYMLQKHNFKKITRQTYQTSLDTLLTDDLENHRYYSLYVDCMK